MVKVGPLNIGIDSVLALVPIGGGLYTVGLGGWLLWQGWKAQAAPATLARMAGYVGVDALTAEVPVLGIGGGHAVPRPHPGGEGAAQATSRAATARCRARDAARSGAAGRASRTACGGAGPPGPEPLAPRVLGAARMTAPAPRRHPHPRPRGRALYVRRWRGLFDGYARALAAAGACGAAGSVDAGPRARRRPAYRAAGARLSLRHRPMAFERAGSSGPLDAPLLNPAVAARLEQ